MSETGTPKPYYRTYDDHEPVHEGHEESKRERVLHMLKNANHDLNELDPTTSKPKTDKDKLAKVCWEVLQMSHALPTNYKFGESHSRKPYHLVAGVCMVLIGALLAILGFMDSALLGLGVFGAIVIVAGGLLIYWSVSRKSEYLLFALGLGSGDEGFREARFHLDNQSNYVGEYKIEYDENMNLTERERWNVEGNQWVDEELGVPDEEHAHKGRFRTWLTDHVGEADKRRTDKVHPNN